jgi:hypothetical protein
MSISIPILAFPILVASLEPPTLDEVKTKLAFTVCVVPKKEFSTKDDARLATELAKQLAVRFTVVHVGTRRTKNSIRGCDGDDFFVSPWGID